MPSTLPVPKSQLLLTTGDMLGLQYKMIVGPENVTCELLEMPKLSVFFSVERMQEALDVMQNARERYTARRFQEGF